MCASLAVTIGLIDDTEQGVLHSRHDDLWQAVRTSAARVELHFDGELFAVIDDVSWFDRRSVA